MSHRLYKRRGEAGAALPMALAFLVLCVVLTSVVVDYTGVSARASTHYSAARRNLYAAEGAVDAAIKWVQSDQLFQVGTAGTTCDSLNVPVNGKTVSVACAPTGNGAGGGTNTTMSPGFAVLTLAPFQGLSPTGGCNNTYDELGLVQVQNDKLLQIHGNVYINSDADSDIWSNGCPQLSTAKHIQVVNGDVLQRASEHDVDSYPNHHNHVFDHNAQGTMINNDVGLPNPLSAADAALLADPGSAQAPNPAAWAPEFTTPPAPGVAKDINGNTITTCPAALASGARFVHFTAGTYTDVTLFNNLTNGTCRNAVLWFEPGNYYFNFGNLATSGGTVQNEWVINDSTVRIVGGQPTGISDPATLMNSSWSPTNVDTANTSGFSVTGATDQKPWVPDNATSNATLSSGTARISLNGFTTQSGTAVPPNATINSVTLRVVHAESNTNLTPSITITPNGGSACTPTGTLTKNTALHQDILNATNCLGNATAIDTNPRFTFTVTKSGSGSATAQFDGVLLDISYTTRGRPAWDPANAATITTLAPAVPGACRHEPATQGQGPDSGWNNGVEFVFGGDSRVNLKSGAFELCNKPHTQSENKQEIVLYGLKGQTVAAVGPTNWTAANIVNGSPGFDTTGANPYTNGRVMNDGLTANANLNSSGARTVTLNQFSATGAWPIPAANQIPAGSTINTVTLQVRHSESSTNSSSGVATPTVTVTPADGSAACGPMSLTRNTSMHTDPVTLTSCLNTPEKLNGLATNNGVGVTYSVSRLGTTNRTDSLDGMQLQVTYTPPASGGDPNALNPGSGCITKTPYYNPPGGNDGPDHAPAFGGACALFRVSTDADGGSFPRIATFWGTVYAPSAALDMPVDVLTTPVFNRGVVARMLMLGYNVANNAVVPLSTDVLIASLQNRRVTFTASVGSSKVTADVEFCDHDATPCGTQGIGGVKVWSWKVTR